MSKVVHTPGPWKPRDYKTKNGGIWIDCDSFANNGKGKVRGGTVCEVLDQGEEIQAANVRLISAAPDLLAALEITIDAECSLRCPSVWRTGEPQPHTDACKNGRAAIAKAKGV